MKKILLVLLVFVCSELVYLKTHALPNPWVDCNDNMYCAAKKAGFNFPLRINNYSLRAMKGLIEIKFPIDKKRIVILRKAQIFDGPYDENGIIDVSGVYKKYPVNKTIKLKNGVRFNTKGEKNKFYVVNFAADSGYYSFYCTKGMKLKDINYFYKILEEAEAQRYSYEEKNRYTPEQLMDLRRVDGVVEPVYTQDCFPRTLEKKGVTKECFLRANLGDDTACYLSEIKMIKEYYKKGQDKDLLNDGSKQFCAEQDSFDN